jgi:hypothetical protein
VRGRELFEQQLVHLVQILSAADALGNSGVTATTFSLNAAPV